MTSYITKTQDRFDYIINLCKSNTVLHLGCTDAPYTTERLQNGTLLHATIEKIAKKQYGIDLDVNGIEALTKAGYQNLATANVEQLYKLKPFGEAQFDVIIAGEIIEHLSNPGLFLDQIKQLMNPNSKLVVTTVNAYCARRFLYCLLKGYETVHPDHVFYYSKSTLYGLLNRHGFLIDEFAFYGVEKYHKHLLNQGKRRVLWWADQLVNHFAPHLADGVIATCKLA